MTEIISARVVRESEAHPAFRRYSLNTNAPWFLDSLSVISRRLLPAGSW